MRPVSGRNCAIWTGLLLFAGFLALFWWGAAPTVMCGDAAELQTAALTNGVAHPPGYPAFILASQLFKHVLPGEPARRITLMSGLFGAACVVLLYGFLRSGLALSGLGAACGACLYGLSFTFWWSAIGPQVYTLAIGFFLCSLILVAATLRKPRVSSAGAAGLFLGLSLAGHRTFSLAVGFMCLVLLWRMRRERRWPLLSMGLAAGIVLGLGTYLQVLWADTHSPGANYLNYTIEASAHQFGVSPESFATPQGRLAYVFVGRESRLDSHLGKPRELLRNFLDVGALEFLFELGPFGAVLILFGLRRLLARRRGLLLLLLGIIVPSVVSSAAFGPGRFRHILLIPATLGMATVAAFGVAAIQELLQRMRWMPRRLVAPACVAVVLLCAAASNGLRAYAYRHPIGPARWRMEVKDEFELPNFIPSFRTFTRGRDFGLAAMRVLPPHAMVIAAWWEFTPLNYFQSVEGLRRDLVLEPYDPAHYVRLMRWQDRYDLKQAPLVLVSNVPSLEPYFEDAETLAVVEGQAVRARRVPLPPLGSPAAP